MGRWIRGGGLQLCRTCPADDGDDDSGPIALAGPTMIARKGPGSEWDARWAALAERFIAEAKRRGGSGVRLGYAVRLHAPRLGECVTVTPVEPHAAMVEVHGQRLGVRWE